MSKGYKNYENAAVAQSSAEDANVKTYSGEVADAAADVSSTEISAAPSNGIVLTMKDAKRIYDLYKNMKSADEHFKSCQSDVYRKYLQDVYKADGIVNAFERLHDAIEKSNGGE